MGHVKMMGAVQPFISGAISKTVNLPEQTTIDEVAQLFVESWQQLWRQGDRDLPRQLQGRAAALVVEGRPRRALPVGATGVVAHPQRRRLPDDRTEVGRKFKVGEYEGYIHVGLFEDGTPWRHLRGHREGGHDPGLMNSFMISVSLGLQYGVPLEAYSRSSATCASSRAA